MGLLPAHGSIRRLRPHVRTRARHEKTSRRKARDVERTNIRNLRGPPFRALRATLASHRPAVFGTSRIGHPPPPTKSAETGGRPRPERRGAPGSAATVSVRAEAASSEAW